MKEYSRSIRIQQVLVAALYIMGILHLMCFLINEDQSFPLDLKQAHLEANIPSA